MRSHCCGCAVTLTPIPFRPEMGTARSGSGVRLLFWIRSRIRVFKLKPDSEWIWILAWTKERCWSNNQGKVPVRDGHGAESGAEPESVCIFWIRILKFVYKQDSGADSESKSSNSERTRSQFFVITPVSDSDLATCEIKIRPIRLRNNELKWESPVRTRNETAQQTLVAYTISELHCLSVVLHQFSMLF